MIRFSNLRLTIRVKAAIRMTIAPVLAIWFGRLYWILLLFVTRIRRELIGFFGSIRFLESTFRPVDVVKHSIEISKASTRLEKVPFLPLIKVIL